MYPWYETREPVVLNLPIVQQGICESLENSSAQSNCFSYKYSIWEGGVFSRFETPIEATEASEEMKLSESDSKLPFTRSLPLRMLDANEEYKVSDILGLKPVAFSSANIQKVVLPPMDAASMHGSMKSLQRKSSNGLMMMDMSRSGHGKVGAGILRPRKAVAAMNLNNTDGVVVASAFLPVHLHRSDSGQWSAEWDYEALLSMSTHLRVTRVGTVKWRGWHGNTGADGSPEGGVPVNERHLVEKCLEPFNCVPVWCSTTQFGEM